MLLTHIWEMVGSNLGWNTSNNEWGCPWFPQSLQAIVGKIFIRPWPLATKLFLKHQLPGLSLTLYRMKWDLYTSSPWCDSLFKTESQNVLTCLVFEIHITIKWANIFHSSVTCRNSTHCIVRCTQDTRCTEGSVVIKWLWYTHTTNNAKCS
jgi:hypothetical protein